MEAACYREALGEVLPCRGHDRALDDGKVGILDNPDVVGAHLVVRKGIHEADNPVVAEALVVGNRVELDSPGGEVEVVGHRAVVGAVPGLALGREGEVRYPLEGFQELWGLASGPAGGGLADFGLRSDWIVERAGVGLTSRRIPLSRCFPSGNI